MRVTRFSSMMFALLTSVSLLGTIPAANATTPASSQSGVTMETAPASASRAGQDAVAAINLNAADAATLQKELIGIGKNKADAIVAYREANGQFTSVDELIEVKGIGKAILDKNRDRLVVE
ncbi:ComEA family DNA-binding protein [Pseudomonas sp. JDS28PS106]|uniref:ComEA family DNA-binding protein n=1 Tax=Pseudomonas sp. JDS28PS106 TaxID=2497235 RepID=UPI002FD6BF4E